MNPIAMRLAFAQSTVGLGNGAFTPFFGAWLAWRGLDAAQIGVLMAAGMLLRVAAVPVAGVIADARNDRRAVMVMLYALIFCCYAALSITRVPELIFAIGIASYVAAGAAAPILESVCMRLAGYLGFDYGHVRLWASSLFIIGNIVSGIGVSYLGLGIIAPWMAGALFLNLIAVLILPKPKGGKLGALSPRLKNTFGEARELLYNPTFIIFMLAASLAQGSHSFYYAYGGLHWQRLGYSGTLIGLIWPLGVFAEIFFLLYSRKIFARLGAGKLLLLGAMACVLRWIIMAFDPPLALVIFAQTLHGASYALSHLGAMYFIAGAVPARLAATAQSLYAVGWAGLATGLATLASGFLYEEFGGLTYLLMAAMGVASVIASAVLMRIWHGRYLTREVGPEIYDTI